MAASTRRDPAGARGVALALSLALATLGCVPAAAPAHLTIEGFTATQTVLEDGSVGIAYTMSVTNDSEHEVDASALPALTVDGVAATQEVCDHAGAAIEKVGAGETVTCAGTAAIDVTEDHEFALESASDAEIEGAEAAGQVANVVEGLREDPHEMVEGTWRPCTSTTYAYTISDIVTQATTEYEPPRLMVRGTIGNDTSNVTAAESLPRLTVDGEDYPITLWVKGRQADALAGRTEDEASTADFEVSLELDPTGTHVIAFTAPTGARLSGADLANDIADYLATFTAQ